MPSKPPVQPVPQSRSQERRFAAMSTPRMPNRIALKVQIPDPLLLTVVGNRRLYPDEPQSSNGSFSSQTPSKPRVDPPSFGLGPVGDIASGTRPCVAKNDDGTPCKYTATVVNTSHGWCCGKHARFADSRPYHVQTAPEVTRG